MIFALIGLIVLVVVPTAVWWSVTNVVPRVLESMGLLGREELQAQEARLVRIEEAIDALALQVDRLSRELPARLPAKVDSVERSPELR
ncbi:MAG: hypothetical protein U0132_15225 [Gemmatimonadaceae bacterium]